MKTKTFHHKAFTIIELLTVMSIIVILIGLLVPALNRVRIYAMNVKQRAQLYSIKTALELFNNEYEGYPDSSAQDPTGTAYCGAMKLCEAMVGQDLMGFHPKSRFRLDGTVDGTAATKLYEPGAMPNLQDNLQQRKGAYLPTENANAYRMKDIYDVSSVTTNNFSDIAMDRFVLCDVYKRVDNLSNTGDAKVGLPILYYKADTSGNYHDPNTYPPTRTSNNGNIYNGYDNMDLVLLGKPWEKSSTTKTVHNLASINTFYDRTQNNQITTSIRPYLEDSYILISAGYDGIYGTDDDITNFKQ